MRKARRKAVSIIVALTFLLGLVFAYAGPAMAGDYAKVSGAYVYVTTGENKDVGYVEVAESVTDGVYQWSQKGVTEVYVTLTLEGATFMRDDGALNDYVTVTGDGDAGLVTASDDSVQVKVYNLPASRSSAATLRFDFNTNYSKLNIPADAAGDIKANVEVMGVSSSGVEWVDTGSVVIAKVQAKGVTVTAGTPKVVSTAASVSAAKITISEAVYEALPSVTETVYLKLESAGVKFVSFTTEATRFVAPFTVTPSSDGKLAWFSVPQRQAPVVPLPGKLEITPSLEVAPNASGDIQVTVYSVNNKVPSTTVTVATVGTVPVAIADAKYTDGVFYAGDTGVVKSGSNPAEFKLKATGGNIAGNKVVTLELSKGKFDATLKFQVEGLSAGDIKLYNDNKSAWFTTPQNKSEIRLWNFSVQVPADAEEGDLVIKVGGTAGASGEVVIGKVKKPFTATSDSVPELSLPGLSQAAGKITITEAGKGAIDGNLKLSLPDGVTFDGKPTVKVTAGSLGVNSAATTVSSDGKTLTIGIDNEPSSIASTIEISGIKYNVSRLALDGDIAVKVSADGWAENGTFTTVVNARAVVPAPPTKREASFVIGSTTYKVNGEDKTMDVAPYIDAASGRTYLPVRYVAYALGVSEDNIFYSNGQVSLLKDGRAVQMTIGSKALVVNGVSITMDAAPVIKDGRTMLPFRWIATALGASVQWDEATKTVTMNIE